MKNFVLVAVLGGIVLANAPTTFAGVCQNVEIHVHDDVSGEIKVVDMDYYDVNSDRWREENFVGNEVVPQGGDYQFERDLEYVEDEWIRVRVWFKWRSSDINPWSSVESSWLSFAQYCQEGEHFDLHIKDTIGGGEKIATSEGVERNGIEARVQQVRDDHIGIRLPMAAPAVHGARAPGREAPLDFMSGSKDPALASSPVTTLESMTQRQSSRSGQQGAFCGSTTGAVACVHGPVGLSLVATPSRRRCRRAARRASRRAGTR